MELDFEGLELTDAARLMVLPSLGRCKRKVEATARRMGMAPSTLYNVLDGYKPLEAKHIPTLTHATGDRLLIEALAYQSGGLFVPFPVPARGADASVLRALTNMIREAGDVAEKVERALDPQGDGGELATSEELESLDSEILELLNALTTLRCIVASHGAES